MGSKLWIGFLSGRIRNFACLCDVSIGVRAYMVVYSVNIVVNGVECI